MCVQGFADHRAAEALNRLAEPLRSHEVVQSGQNKRHAGCCTTHHGIAQYAAVGSVRACISKIRCTCTVQRPRRPVSVIVSRHESTKTKFRRRQQQQHQLQLLLLLLLSERDGTRIYKFEPSRHTRGYPREVGMWLAISLEHQRQSGWPQTGGRKSLGQQQTAAAPAQNRTA